MMQCTYPLTTPCRKPEALSTTSSQTLDTRLSSKSVASGRDCRASSDSCNSSLHRSESSPDRHARRRKAKAKLRAALDPTLAKPIVAFSAGFMELKFRLTFYSLHQIRFVKLFRHVSRKRNRPVTFEIKIYWYMWASHVLAWSTCVEIKWTWQDYLTLNCTGKTTKLLNLILYKKKPRQKRPRSPHIVQERQQDYLVINSDLFCLLRFVWSAWLFLEGCLPSFGDCLPSAMKNRWRMASLCCSLVMEAEVQDASVHSFWCSYSTDFKHCFNWSESF